MIYAIDFDGTIVENKFPQIGELNQHTADFIRHIKSAGHKLKFGARKMSKTTQVNKDTTA